MAAETGAITTGIVTGIPSVRGVAWVVQQPWTRLATFEGRVDALEQSQQDERQELQQALKDMRLESQQGFSKMDDRFCKLEEGLHALSLRSVIGAALMIVYVHLRS